MNTIDPEKYYNTSDILRNSYFPWVKSMPSIIKWIERDLKSNNILGSIRVGTGTGTRYLIKGENLIKFIAQFEDGSLSFEQKEIQK